MIENHLKARGIKDKRVIDAFLKVPRELFVPEGLKNMAYQDSPLPIGFNQTISQPFVVASMLEAVDIKPDYKVLEVGTGSGYQTALLCELAKEVYSLEIIEELAVQAKNKLQKLGYTNFHIVVRNGYDGLPEFAPYDAIIVSAAPEFIPQALIDQLKVNRKMIIPVGRSGVQDLLLIHKTPHEVRKEVLYPVRFVPLVNK